ncbi:MAG: DUF4114 domain-containing protein, partial [Shimia sp.]
MANDDPNQTFDGTENDDAIQGGSGRDTVTAEGGDDHVRGGSGDDSVQGGAGDDFVGGDGGQDTIVGDTRAEYVFDPEILSIAEDYNVKMTFLHEGAGYKNTVGVYRVDPNSGEITDVQIAWQNASAQGSGGDLVQGQSQFAYDVFAGDHLGFFLIGDGFNQNDFSQMQNGTFRFVNAQGDPAIVDGAPPTMQFVDDQGNVTDLQGEIYHSTSRNASPNLNTDGIDHALGTASNDLGTFRLGFEDTHGGGDLDFDDVLFEVEIGAVNGSALFSEHLDPNPGGDDRLEGRAGNDQIEGNGGDDLVVGGGAGAEWQLVNGKWVYAPDALPTQTDPDVVFDGSDDVLVGAAGEDVLIGNAGNDVMHGGGDYDRIIGGTGDDSGHGGFGDDMLNMEAGDDFAEGGAGADTVNAGAGDDVIYGDDVGRNVLRTNGGEASFASYSELEAWEVENDPDSGFPSMSQEITLEDGEAYTLSFDLAANLSGGFTQGAVEVRWNGELVDTVETASTVFETHEFSITGTGEPGILSFKNVSADGFVPQDPGPVIDTSTPIFHYDKQMDIGGQSVDVAGFAPGQSKLYQVIDGQLKVFDTETSSYVDAGPSTGLKVNAIGFNVEDDMIYGIAKKAGTDALGNAVSVKD